MDDRVAEVVCRQMGWAKGRLVELSIVADAPSTRQVWIDNMNCPSWPSTETHVEQCDHNNKDQWNWGTNDCTHAKDIGVGCDA